MQDDGSASCACKGIRRCLKCENGKGTEQLEANEAKAVHQFRYDPETRRAVPRDADSSCFPFPGVFLQQDFISEEEEEALIRTMDRDVWNESQSGRRKQDFGPKVNFKKRKVRLSTFSGLPAVSRALVLRMQSDASLEDFRPVEQCNLEYLPQRGSSIDPHLDDSWLWGERLSRKSRSPCFFLGGRCWCCSERRDTDGNIRSDGKIFRIAECAAPSESCRSTSCRGGRHEEMGAKLLDISLSFRGTPA
ncbi:hypothetical protein KUCAC02_034476 [Chaenocephalus aceratus]|nr:hypothetical protein KUCAC02_034476 [Chaenocephalus aceratus]